MLDAKKILDQFLGSGSGGQSSGGPVARTGGQGAPTSGSSQGGMGDLLNQIGGMTRGGGGGGGGGGGALGGLAGGALAGGLASILLGKGKKSLPMSGSAMKLGGLAILGGLAYKAWQNYQEKQQAAGPGQPAEPTPSLPRAEPVQVAPPPQDSAFAPSNAAEEEKLGLLLIRAMIAAARADGHIDRDEIAKIREGLKAAGTDGEEQDFLIDYLGKPDDLDAIAAEARGPELASEVWLAARLTIDPDTPQEQAFLKNFAEKLGLGAPLVAHLEQTAAQAKQSGVAAG